LSVGVLFFLNPEIYSQPLQPVTEQKLISEVGAFEQLKMKNQDHRKLALFLKKALETYDGVRNYKAIFSKTELSKGVLGLREKIYLKFEKPWKIYMGWLNTEKKGLQVVYERGKHGGKLAIHKPGLLLGLAPVVFLDPNSPWMREGSASYDIEDAGIGTFLYDFTKAVLKAGRKQTLEVHFRGRTKEEGLSGEKVEVVFKDSGNDPDYFAHRIVTVFDEKSGLPVYMELFDRLDRVTGIYSYENLKINVGKNDEEFKKQINRQLLRVYEEKSTV